MGHDPGMKSRVHPKYKTKYRVSNWADYDRALVQRGDITLWISEDAIASWKPAPSGKRGAQRKFSDHAIETALTLRLVFKLPLRQAEGFLRSILSLIDVDLEAPDHTTLSRRSQRLDVALHLTSTKKPIHLIVDSTGLSIAGEGEWAAARHGGRGKRAWKKLHLGVDRSGVIVAEALTDGGVNDAKTALALIDNVAGAIESLTADSAYDTLAIYGASAELGAEVIVPPSKSATRSHQRRSRSIARDRTIIRVKEIGRR
jgi:IS5 family transposase